MVRVLRVRDTRLNKDRDWHKYYIFALCLRQLKRIYIFTGRLLSPITFRGSRFVQVVWKVYRHVDTWPVDVYHLFIHRPIRRVTSIRVLSPL